MTLALAVLVLIFAGLFAAQVWSRLRLIVAARNTFSIRNVSFRLRRWVLDVALQRRTIAERPVVGLAHAFVFWGFVAFAGYTVAEFLRGLGIVDLTHTAWFELYRSILTVFALCVLLGIALLLIRRGIQQPVELGRPVSAESIVIGVLIATLMVTFLLSRTLSEDTLPGLANRWLHLLVVLGFLALIPASKHFHLVLSPFTVFLKSTTLGDVPNLDLLGDEVGLETVKDLGSKSVLDALTCVECGRCQVNCPAWSSGKELNPKTIILQTQQALLSGPADRSLAQLYTEEALWQCTTCGACENQCPVGIEHLPLLIGSRRGLVSNGGAPSSLGAVYNHLDRRGNIWGLGHDQRQRFLTSANLDIFDPSRHELLVWLGCAGSYEADYQKSMRSLFDILRARGVTFGVLAKERCTGDPAKRTGNEYLFQELANANIEDLRACGVKTIVTSCPHCVKTIGDDYLKFGYRVRIVHSAVYLDGLLQDAGRAGAATAVTFHDPCYLGRYQRTVEEPRNLLKRFGGTISEPERARENPFCCGAGGGLLFADKEEEPGSRISDIRLKQLTATGAGTIVTACPFCSIMLKGASMNAGPAGANTQFVDLATFVRERLSRDV